MEARETSKTLSCFTENLKMISVIVLSAQPEQHRLVWKTLSALSFYSAKPFVRGKVSVVSNCRNFIFWTRVLKLKMAAKQELNHKFKRGKNWKQDKSEGEAAMPVLKPPDPECTFVLGAFLIVLPWQPEQCWKALSLWYWLKMIFSIMHLASN